MHTAVLFVKFPIISKMNVVFIILAVLIILLLSLFEDQDLIGYNFLKSVPHFAF